MATKKGLTKTEVKKLKSIKKEKNKIVKLKIDDVISWLFFPDDKILQNIINRKTDLGNMFFRLPKVFYKFPLLVIQLNKLNDLYDSWDNIDILYEYRRLIEFNNITIQDVTNIRWNVLQRENFITEYSSKSSDYQRIEYASLYHLNSKIKSLGFNLNLESLNPESLKNNDLDQDLKENILNINKIKKELKFKNDDRFLQEITQEIIDQLELTIFDVKLLRRTNEVLYIFLAKNSEKKYYKEHMKIDFFYSKNDYIMLNDYIQPYDSSIHTKYTIIENNHYYQLKKAIFSNFNKSIRLEQ